MHHVKFGMIYSTMFGLEKMTKRSDSRRQQPIILNIASVVGLDPCHRLPIYSASKHAIIGFSRAYSVKQNSMSNWNCTCYCRNLLCFYLQHDNYYARSGVEIVVLCPGATLTSFGRQFAGKMIVPNEHEALTYFRSTPKQRYIRHTSTWFATRLFSTANCLMFKKRLCF